MQDLQASGGAIPWAGFSHLSLWSITGRGWKSLPERVVTVLWHFAMPLLWAKAQRVFLIKTSESDLQGTPHCTWGCPWSVTDLRNLKARSRGYCPEVAEEQSKSEREGRSRNKVEWEGASRPLRGRTIPRRD